MPDIGAGLCAGSFLYAKPLTCLVAKKRSLTRRGVLTRPKEGFTAPEALLLLDAANG